MQSRPSGASAADEPDPTSVPVNAVPGEDGAPPVERKAALRRFVGTVLRGDAGAAQELREDEITPMPPVPPGEEVVEVREIAPPYARVRILFDPKRNTHRYEVIEPPLTQAEVDHYAFIKEAFLRTLDVDLDALDRVGARAYMSERFQRLARRHHIELTPLSRARLSYYLERDFLGFGLIDVVMQDPSIEDISCDGPALPIFIYHRKYESVKTNLSFPSDETLDGYVMQIVQRSGKHISVAEPLVDATLPEGSRLQATLSREVTTRGSTFTIRKFRRDPFTPTDLLIFETLSPEMGAYLWLAVEHGASALICGGTASGKTTTLNALSTFIPPQKKIVSIEDTRELNLLHENWIPGVTRAGGQSEDRSDGRRVGEVDMFDLLRAALRQRPEYLLLGEVRGKEAYVLFQAMATGHTVYSTMHADGVASAVHRLESRPIEIPRTMLSSLDVVAIQGEVRVGTRRVRKVREIVELTGIDPRTGELLTNRVFHWDGAEGRFRYSGASFVLGRIAEEAHWTDAQLRQEVDRRVRVLVAMQKRSIRDIQHVTSIVNGYAIDPERTVADLEAGRIGA
ncbi:MAG TPA: type II/IV secretion system ATPase subunit [Candidatus Thermoplasmatota archaeon]|nr:type II/IV secretion system ATPase subunit [Candidatus Thermoplasmatota archaeon]